MKTITKINVVNRDLDDLGHVNNSVYLNYLETAREHWYKEAAGLSFKDMMEMNLGTVVIKLEILFKKEAVLGDRLEVTTSPIKIGNTSFEFHQLIINQHGEVVADASVLNVMIDLTLRKSVPVISHIARNLNH
ncbi:thioesterase superfamily protein [Neobacillus bataviensis LMG 21833]|uniref:Thioesterase superfamily protein n=1 Tax=Neobacillus bataviensis LMG 21833 TaxID=1117379 RepID=K6DFY6_9BACI|nr:acyl-CoA thioesterase [Neobacillus bataviensis]EKN66973.1 thioesterase superfamily protein [Neobacillus bataviensis LMG 21833]